MALRSLERDMSVYLLPSEIQCAMLENDIPKNHNYAIFGIS